MVNVAPFCKRGRGKSPPFMEDASNIIGIVRMQRKNNRIFFIRGDLLMLIMIFAAKVGIPYENDKF